MLERPRQVTARRLRITARRTPSHPSFALTSASADGATTVDGRERLQDTSLEHINQEIIDA